MTEADSVAMSDFDLLCFISAGLLRLGVPLFAFGDFLHRTNAFLLLISESLVFDVWHFGRGFSVPFEFRSFWIRCPTIGEETLRSEDWVFVSKTGFAGGLLSFELLLWSAEDCLWKIFGFENR
jgi:hypothetical protein